MFERMRLQELYLRDRAADRASVLMDSDVVVNSDPADIFSTDFDVGLTWRTEFPDAPFNGGMIFVAEGDAAAGDYVLTDGTLEPRKNLERLVAGFHQANLNGCRLLIAGMRGWGDVDVTGDSVSWLGFVPDDELARLYRGARCVAYLSPYEGFGLPLVEAMACGAPVLAADEGSAPEVTGGAAVLVDPLDPDAIAKGLAEAVDRGEELRALGVARARDFNWDTVAQATLDVYREAAA
jgi:glycosyltransferase involved in cell wall biosynthesis